jgi:DNA-binding MarR family transcriptional regulator
MRVDYRSLADLRYHIRGFLAVREAAARAAGLEPQQYLLLLQMKGRESDGPATVGMLAERLHIKHHSAVELVDRLCARKLVARRRSRDDRRQVIVEMRPAGRAVLERLAIHALAELHNVGPALIEVLARLGMTGSRRRARGALGSARKTLGSARKTLGSARKAGGSPRGTGPPGRGAARNAVRRPTRNGGPP